MFIVSRKYLYLTGGIILAGVLAFASGNYFNASRRTAADESGVKIDNNKTIINQSNVPINSGVAAAAVFEDKNTADKTKKSSSTIPAQSSGEINGNISDANRDGLTDEEAKKIGLDPSSLDTDGDGIFDVDEINTTKTNPLKKDTDGDGYDDLEEIRNGFNPNGPGKLEIKK